MLELSLFSGAGGGEHGGPIVKDYIMYLVPVRNRFLRRACRLAWREVSREIGIWHGVDLVTGKPLRWVRRRINRGALFLVEYPGGRIGLMGEDPAFSPRRT